MLTLSIPTYHMNMVMIGGQMFISKFDLEGKKIKILASRVCAYGPKEHSYTFIALSYQNCRRRKILSEKSAKKRQ